MPDNFKQNKKNAQEFNKELGYIEDQILNIAASLSGAVKDALEDLKDEGKQVGEILVNKVDKGIKSLAKGLDLTLRNQIKLEKGMLSSADISQQMLDNEAKRQGVLLGIQQLVDQKLLKDGEEAKLKAELNEAMTFSNDLLKKQLKEAAAIEKRMGAIGGIVKGISKIPIIGELINADEILGKIQAKAAKTKGSFAGLEVAAYGIGQILGSAFETITDPTVIFTGFLKAAGEIAKQQKEFRSLTGQNVDITNALGEEFVTTGEYIKAATELSKELGVNAAVVFSPETIKEVAELTENMGLGAHEAAQLAKFAKISGKPLSEVTANVEASFKSFVGQNNTAMNFGDVMNDIGSVSAATSLSLGSSAEAVQEAAMQARKLGLSLEQVDQIAGSILDFESSIQAEMEAELLTGKQLNLDRARALALNNDLAGLSEEIGKNTEILAAFSSGNRIQQEATAKALGMSREEVAKMIYNQKIQNNLSDEQAAKAAGISLEEAKRLSIQGQIEKSVAKITEALAGPLTLVAELLSNTAVLYLTVTAIGVSLATKAAPALKSMAKNMFDLGKGALTYVKNLMKGQGILGSLKGAGGDDKAGDVMEKVTKSTDKIKPGAGKMIQSFLTGLGKGLSALGKAVMGPQAVGIAIGIGLVSVGVIALGAALGLAAPAIKAFGTVVTAVFDGLGTIITKVAEGFVMIMEAVSMENILPMLLLGPALFGIAGGLLAVGLAGIKALPVLAGLGALALVATPLLELAGVFGGGDGGGDDTSQIIEKLDKLIEVVEKGGDVYMDGNKVGKSLVIASSGIG